MNDLTPFSIVIPWPGMPKARPRVTENGTYMPPKYVEWKKNVAQYLGYQSRRVEGPVSLYFIFTEGHVHVRVVPIVENYQRDKGVKADIDNLIGGVMDAMEEAGTLVNDSQVVHVTATIQNRRSRG